MGECDDFRRRVDELERENQYLRKIVRGYEEILKLNEREIDNGENIIEMFEQVVEFDRVEKKMINETAKAFESTSELSRSELERAYDRIRELERQIEKLTK